MMKHYLQVKEKYKDCVLFYRLGDFYEMFFDDAVRVSAALDLTLTGRDCGLEERAPMCGVPYHAADLYISRLVEQGFKVAICEQLTEPDGRNLVERDVIKIITAGTLTEETLIDEKSNNFLVCVYAGKDGAAASWADITTGEFFVKNIAEEEQTDGRAYAAFSRGDHLQRRGGEKIRAVRRRFPPHSPRLLRLFGGGV